MKKRVLLVVGLIVLIAGVIVSNFAKFPLADVLGYAVTMFGAGLAVAGMYEKRDPSVKTWVVWLGIILVGFGAFSITTRNFWRVVNLILNSNLFVHIEQTSLKLYNYLHDNN